MIFFLCGSFLGHKKSIAFTMLLFPFELDINRSCEKKQKETNKIYILLKLDINA